MYRVLEAEMVLNDVKRQDLADELDLTLATVSLKLNGKAPITMKEARLIKQRVGTTKTLDELFADEKTE